MFQTTIILATLVETFHRRYMHFWGVNLMRTIRIDVVGNFHSHIAPW